MAPNTDSRATLEQLSLEFASISPDFPILHELLYGLPNQQLSPQSWEEFRNSVNSPFVRKKRDEWDEWHPHPDGLACSRFVGTGDKSFLNTFRRLANTGMAVLRNAAIIPEPTWHFDTSIVDWIESDMTDDAFVNWLYMVHQTAKQCRTLNLHATIGNWGGKRKYQTVEEVASDMSNVVGGFPISPILEKLEPDVFKASAEAIKVWLGLEDVKRVGIWTERPPIYLPPSTQDEGSVSKQVDSGNEQGQTLEQAQQQSGTSSGQASLQQNLPDAALSRVAAPIIEIGFDDPTWSFRYEFLNIKESGPFTNDLNGFRLYKVILERGPDAYKKAWSSNTFWKEAGFDYAKVSLVSGGSVDGDADDRRAFFDDDDDDDPMLVEDSPPIESLDDDGRAKLNKELNDLIAEHDKSQNPERKVKLHKQIKIYKAYISKALNIHGKSRALDGTAEEKARKRITNALTAARNNLAKSMPSFVQYLLLTVTNNGGWSYDPRRALALVTKPNKQ